MKICKFLLLFMLVSSPCLAVGLAEMQKMALQNRQLIQKYEVVLEQSEKDIVLARSNYYPSIDLGYTVNSLDEASTTEHKENSIARASISLNLFSGFSHKYRLKAAELGQLGEQYRLQGIKQDLQLEVALAYLDVYERKANSEVAKAAFQTLEKVYRDGESRFQVGLIGKNELLKFRVDYDNADITLKSANAGLSKSINELGRQIGAAISLSDLDFADFGELPQQIDKDQYRKKMLAERSEIKILEAIQQANAAQAKTYAGGYYPQINVVGSYSNYDDNYVNGAGDIDEDEVRLQLALSMNLFQGFSTQTAIARAKLDVRAAQLDLEELLTTLDTSLENLFIDFEVSLKNVDVANRSIEQAEENLRITQLKYDEGLQRESDLLDAITSLSRAKYNHVAVIRTAFLNKFQLIRMVDGFPRS
jgi:outer membrane protein